MNSFQQVLDAQNSFQKFMGHDFKVMSLKEKAHYIKENILWATDELHEMLHELPYAKHWSKKYDSMTDEKITDQLTLTKEEYIDAFHFVMNIGLALGLDEETIFKMYREKNRINYDRQFTNY